MAETNQFNIEVGVDTKDSISKLKELGSTLEGVASSVKGSTSSMSSSFTAMSAKLGSSLKSVGSTMSVGLTAPLALLGTALFNSAAQMEQISVSFEVFTGSAETAKNMLAQLKDQALKSPMQFQDITKGAQTLLGYGLTAEQVIPITRMLGDISGGNADKFGRLALAFGQVNAAGRLMGQETRQMINAGFNPLQSISEKTGESMASLSKRMKDGQISVQEVADAFKYATSEGGRFFGNADKQSQTLQGQLNKLQESVTFALAEIGTSLANNGGLKQFFESLTATVTKVKDAFLALSPETQSLILKFGLILATAGPLLIFFGSLFTAIGSISTAVGVLTVAFTGLNLVTGGLLVGLGLFVAAMVGVAQNAREAADSVDNMNKRLKATNDTWNGPDSITESVKYLKNQLRELESRQAFNVKFNTAGIEDTSRKILKAREDLAALEKNIGKQAPIKGFSKTPVGLDDSQTKGEKSKIEKLIQANKDAVAQIAMIWMSATDRRLADLKLNYDQEIRDYVKYKLDYSNITKKYEAEKAKILQDSTRQREANNIKAHATELAGLDEFYTRIEQKERQRQANAIKNHQEEVAGLQTEYPKFSGDFATDALNTDLAGNLKNYGEAFYAATKDFAINMSSGFAEIASTALMGGLSMADTFKSLGSMILSSLGDYLIKIGTAAIAAGTVGTILKTFFTGGAATVPELGIAGGMAAVAVGSAMKALSGKVSDSMSKTKMPGKSGSTASSVASRASGASYQYGGASYSTQSVRLMVDLTGSITATQTGYSINKSLETTLRVTGR
jgi:tape measure domain-containing protein